MAVTAEQITAAIERLQPQLPALANLKLVFSLELTAGGLTGPAKAQRFRIEMPGPKVSEAEAGDARLQLSIPAAMFGILAAEGDLMDWKEAFFYGHLRVEGDPRVRRLLGRAVEASEEVTGAKRKG